MKTILSIVVLILAIVGGAVGGDMMKTRKMDALSASAHDSADPKSDSHSKDKDKGDKKKDKKKKDKKKKDKKKDGKKGGHDEVSDSESVSYLKFKRQFVVPVLTGGRIDSLVIMNFNIELKSDAPDNIYSYEPKLRDALMRELLALSNTGIFGEDLTSPETYESVRKTMLKATQAVVSDGIKDILILDIARQDQ